MNFPKPNVIQRPINAEDFKYYIDQGLSEIQANILSARRPQNIDPMHILKPELSLIPEPLLLIGMDKASDLIAEYLLTDSRPIVLSTDFDVDGVSSAAVMMSILSGGGVLDINNNTVIPIISNRLNDGYGFTDKVVDKILSMDVLPGIVITADHGSSNGQQISRLVNEAKLLGHQINVIVTDHHSIPEGGGPQDAFAFINPNQGGDTYPDKTICGATVAWLTMLASMNKLISAGKLSADTSIDSELDYACAATVADCVSIASPVNRYIIKNGLVRMNAETRPAWTAFKELMATPYEGITTDTIGFQLGPKINANSRMGFDGKYALEFLLAKSVFDAKKNLASLNINNEDRKSVEKNMLEGALEQASKQYDEGRSSLVIYMPEGMHSVHGIVASRIVEKFGCPTMCVSPKQEGVVSASLRSIDGFDIKLALDNIQDTDELLIGYGGHTMAAGCSFELSNLERVTELFEIVTCNQLKEQPKPLVYVDKFTSVKEIVALGCVDSLNNLKPYGREFEYPLFTTECSIVDIYAVGKDKTHAKVELMIEDTIVDAIWFKARKDLSEDFIVNKGDNTQVIFSVNDNYFRGERSVQLMINVFL